jgi:hypothetical protein
MPRGKVIKLKKGQLVFIGGMAVHARDGKVEVFVYGDGKIVAPNHTRDDGPFDTLETIHKAWEKNNGDQVDQADMQGARVPGCNDLSDRS